MTRDPRRAYHVVDLFEQELCAYTNSPYAITTNSCTNALLLALTWERLNGVQGPIRLPRHTYVGVLQSVLNAGFNVEWWGPEEYDWQSSGGYWLLPSSVLDFARELPYGGKPTRGHICLSFHSAKQLPLGRGGAILTDNPEAAEWFQAARMDGRPPGQPITKTVFPAYHCPMPPDTAARGLDILSRWNDTGYQPAPLPHTDYPDLSQLNWSTQ